MLFARDSLDALERTPMANAKLKAAQGGNTLNDKIVLRSRADYLALDKLSRRDDFEEWEMDIYRQLEAKAPEEKRHEYTPSDRIYAYFLGSWSYHR